MPSLSPLKSSLTKRKISLVCDGKLSKSFEFAKRVSFYLGDTAEVAIHHIDDSINVIPCCGALKCLTEDYCVFDASDDYMKIYENIVKDSDSIIFFTDIQNNFVSYHLKRFIDRSFRYLHKEQYENKYIGYILFSEKNVPSELINYLTLFTKFQMGQLVGIMSNAFYNNDLDLDKSLYDFSLSLNYLAENAILSPNGYEHDAPWLVYKKNCPRFL
jgi:multimeric flavodoxin WrbA